MKQEIREWARTCIPCQKCKVHRHTKSKFGEYEVPDTRFSVIHIDLIGPLPPSQGMTFCMTCIDRFSCWMEAVPLPDCKAETASKAFYEHWVCRFGVPGKIVTDQGRQFESQLFRSLAAICGAKVAHATSYHPQCNGKVERLHRTLKGAIKAHNNIKWTETLPTILLGLRTALRPDTNHTIAQMTFMDDLKPTKSSPPKNQKIFVHKDLKSCTHVFVRVDRVRKALEPPYNGPFPVKERYEKYFTLTIKNKPVNISVDRLKPAYLLMTDSIPDKTTVPCKQSDDTNLLTDVKPTVSRHGRLVKETFARVKRVICTLRALPRIVWLWKLNNLATSQMLTLLQQPKRLLASSIKSMCCFQKSSKRWDIVKTKLKLTLKPLSETRWESRIGAVKAIFLQFDDISKLWQSVQVNLEVAIDTLRSFCSWIQEFRNTGYDNCVRLFGEKSTFQI
ncbi:retrovirus-related Pol polyprotein from transposon 412 [Trichonephila clavipes]|nr:retrovirus-related Pol polyprotein from transposon 412 [Trichonephila clavipes]